MRSNRRETSAVKIYQYYIFWTVLGFLLGGILFSVHIVKFFKHIDIRKVSADHNPGSANAFKYAGIPVGMLCVICDIAKGFFPVFFALRFLDPRKPLISLVVSAPVLGHALAPYYRSTGGKGIATSFGCLLALLPGNRLVIILMALYLFFSLVYIIRPNERRTVVTFSLFVILGCVRTFFTGQWAIYAGSFILSVIVISRNIRDARFPALAKREEADR